MVLLPAAKSQSFPAFNWIKEIDNSGTDSLAGLATDAQGNIYIAGSTLSPTFPTKSPAQSHSGSSGLYRIDGTGSAWLPLGLSNASFVAPDPLNAANLYAVSGGAVVRSTDGGATFSPLNLPDSLVFTIVVDPTGQALYAGTADKGILKSTDGGATWNASNSGIPFPSNGQSGIGRIWIDPAAPNVLFAQGSVLSRSSDGGATWQTAYGSDIVENINFDAVHPGVLYVGTLRSGVLASTDHGQTLTPLNVPQGLFTVVPDPTQPGRLVGATEFSLFESVDGGATWNQHSPANFNTGIPVFGLLPDWANHALYTFTSAAGVLRISSDLQSAASVGPPGLMSTTWLALGNGHLYVSAYATHDIFVMKLDQQGNIVWSTYFGGGGEDNATAMTIDPTGNVFVTGTTNSRDFPITKGAYASSGTSFVFRLNQDGALGYSTYYAGGPTNPAAVAVDPSGSAWISGSTTGGLPVTPGAYDGVYCCPPVPNGFFFVLPNPQAFLARFDAAGSSLVFSTYLGGDGSSGDSLLIAPDGSGYVGGQTGVFHMNASGTALLASMRPGLAAKAMSFGPDGNIYLAGATSVPAGPAFQPTAGAFQGTFPALPNLPYQGGLAPNAAIAKVDPALKNILAATYFASLNGNEIKRITIDSAGNVYVAGDGAPTGLPTRTPLAGGFDSPTGFLGQLSSDLSSLEFSSYFGAVGRFSVTGLGIGANGQIVLGGATGSQFGGYSSPPNNLWLNSIAIAPPPALRIDSVDNAASQLDSPISTGETIFVRGAGFSADAQLTIGGTPVTPLAVTPTVITAVVPDGIPQDAAGVQVQVDGATSNQVLAPVAAAAPGVYSADGTGLGQGYILNQDGTLNTPTNPAVPGQKITIFATGVGPVSFTQCCAVTQYPVDVFVDGFYCNGVSAVMSPVAGFPGDVFQITVFVPNPADLVANNPDLKNFKFPPLVGLTMRINGATSQNGISLSIAQ